MKEKKDKKEFNHQEKYIIVKYEKIWNQITF